MNKKELDKLVFTMIIWVSETSTPVLERYNFNIWEEEIKCMRKKEQLELINPRVWKDKSIKYETKIIYKILCTEQSERCEFTGISIGRIQKIMSITNVGFKKNLQILEDNKYIRFNEYDKGLYTYEIC
jgi:hypothetical protein